VGQPKQIAETWFQRVWIDHDETAIFELAEADSVGHIQSEVRFFNLSAFHQIWKHYVTAIPDIQIAVEDIIEQGNQVVVRWYLTGTHSGDGFGFPPTFSRIEVRGMTWFKVRDGRIYEGWDCWNQARLMQILVGDKPADEGLPGL